MMMIQMVVIREVLQEETGGKVINILSFACPLAKTITKETENKIYNILTLCLCLCLCRFPLLLTFDQYCRSTLVV